MFAWRAAGVPSTPQPSGTDRARDRQNPESGLQIPLEPAWFNFFHAMK